MYSIVHFFLKGKTKFIIEIWMHIESNEVKSITKRKYTKAIQ